MKTSLHRARLDWRLWALLIPAALILFSNVPVALTIGYSFAVVIVFAAASHLLRKVLFPYVDLRALVDKAVETPLASAVVFLGIAIVLSAIFIANAIWLSH